MGPQHITFTPLTFLFLTAMQYLHTKQKNRLCSNKCSKKSCLLSGRGECLVAQLVRPWPTPSSFLPLPLSLPNSDRLLAKMSHFTLFVAFFSCSAKSGTSQFQTKKRAGAPLFWHLEHYSDYRVITITLGDLCHLFLESCFLFLIFLLSDCFP